MKNITIGVIGAGLIGRKHLGKLAERNDYDLVGIADVNVDRVAIIASCLMKPGPRP
jgi:predicted dehydrogenase